MSQHLLFHSDVSAFIIHYSILKACQAHGMTSAMILAPVSFLSF